MKVAAVLAITLLCLCLQAQSASTEPESSDPDSSVEKRDRYRNDRRGYNPFHDDCLVYGYRYRHNQEFSIPGYSRCLRYRCNRGSWSVIEEACELDGRCLRLGSTRSKNCRTYRCVKERQGRMNFYRARVERTMCEDYYRRCRSPGETFPKTLGGQFWSRCTCLVWNEQSQVRYSCSSHE